MILDYANNQLVVIEEKKERLINLHDKTSFILCERIREGKFEIPFVAFPILKAAIAKAGYSLSLTDNLKNELVKVSKKRNVLLRLRKSLEGINHPQVTEIVRMTQILAKAGGFQMTQEQLETVVFGVIGQRVLIGNEIGTGKTLTVNMIAKVLIQMGLVKKVGIFVPASLITNFEKDYIKFFGNSGVITVRKQTKEKRTEIYRKFHQNPNLNFLITNFEKCNYDFEVLQKLKLDMICVDEFHNMRNFEGAQRSINFFKLIQDFWKPKFRFPMTGTPIENGLFDLYATFKLLDDGNILGGQRYFENNFVVYKPVYFKRNGRTVFGGDKCVGFKHKELLKDMIRPYVIRKQLKLPVDLYINHIPLDLPNSYVAKIKKIIEDVKGGSARYHAIRQFLNVSSREGLTENIKHDAVLDICNQTSEKVLIFSFYKCTLPSLSEFLEANGHKCMTYCGEDTKLDALTVIDNFEKSDAKCLIVTDKMNYGANIQFARIVIQYDLPMKPTIFFQRSGRCYRTGQTKDVHVYSMYFTDSVEETIKENLERKEEVLREIFFKLDSSKRDDLLIEQTDEENNFEKRIYEMLEKMS